MKKDLKTATLCVQGGWKPGNGDPRVLPIFQSTTFKYDTTEQMARLFDLEEAGYFYTRLQNPTNDAVASKIAALEGGIAAMLTSSGQAANFFAVFNICGAGDHIVSSSAIYGGTFNLFAVTLKKLGIDCTFVDPDASEDEISAAFRSNTKALFGETIANPGMNVLDIEKFARVAKAHGVPLIVDNTFATPVNCRPFEWGADIVTHSTTKYMDGHAVAVGGAVVDSGNFDWEAHADKYPGLTTPDDSYHGLTYTKKFGKMSLMAVTTTSGAICLQTKMEDAVTKFGVSRKVADFTGPITMSMNSCGAAMCYVTAIFFMAQSTGIEMTVYQMGMAILLSCLMCMGTISVPGGSVIVYTFLASSLGLPMDSIAVLIGIDWFAGMFRTLMNVDVDVMVGMLVAKKLGELDLDVYNDKKTVAYE